MVFALTFFVCRVLFGPFVTYYALRTPTGSNIVKVKGTYLRLQSHAANSPQSGLDWCLLLPQIGAAAIQVVSLFWAQQIYSVVTHKSKKRKAVTHKTS